MFQRSRPITGLPKIATAGLRQQCHRCLHQALSKRQASVFARGTAMTYRRNPIVHPVQCFHVSASLSAGPKSNDRGPASKEDTQTDFTAMDILSSTPPPTTAIDACMEDGFALNNGSKISKAGVMLIGGEALMWRPWTSGKSTGNEMTGKLRNPKGQFHLEKHSWGTLDLVWPKPDLLIIGTGSSILPLSPETRNHIAQLGIRVEVQDTRNAAAQFNLLATERGVHQVVAALVPIGWREAR